MGRGEGKQQALFGGGSFGKQLWDWVGGRLEGAGPGAGAGWVGGFPKLGAERWCREGCIQGPVGLHRADLDLLYPQHKWL